MQTELNAVNELLQKIREAPVNSLADPLPEEAAAALTKLRNTSIDVQSFGWKFNTVFDQPLSPTTGNVIPVGVNCLKIEFDPSKNSSSIDPVARGEYLYDAANDTDEFTGDVYTKRIVRHLSWDQLPEVVRRYITKRAAREFASDMIGNTSNLPNAAQEEQRAWAAMLKDFAINSGANMLDSPDVAQVAWRNGMRF